MANSSERITELLSSLVGDSTSASLTAEERAVDAAESDALLEARLIGDNHVARRTSEGRAAVALDEAGRMVEYRPDGTSVDLIG